LPGGETGLVTDKLRAQLLDRIKSISLNSVARAVEMSPSGLDKFLSGGPLPNPRRNKLTRWLRETERTADVRTIACVRSVMELVADLPDGRKMPAVRAVLEALRAEFKPGVAGVPLWLARLVAAYENPQPRGHGGNE
jgi:hypothetical protein